MSKTIYTISSEGGQELTTGIQIEREARRIAQQHADNMGETVYLSASDASGDEAVTPRCTAATITDSQIRRLRREAAAAGDDLQVLICRIALASGLTETVDPGDHRSALESLGIIPEHIDADVRARAECASVIADAEAQ